MQGFNENILNIINMFEREVFVVQQDFKVNCTCVNFDTKQPDPGCMKCLGTGKKIKIKKIRVARQDTGIPGSQRPLNELLIAVLFYIKTEYPVAQDNIIVDGDEVFNIYQKRDSRSFKGEKVYQHCLATPKKLDTKVFVNNFNKIVGGKA